MVRYIFISILLFILLAGGWWYFNYDEAYYKVCKSPQKHSNFKELNIEDQFQTYLKYNCKYDSVSARSYWGFYIGEKEGAVNFLLNKLLSENNEDTLNYTLWILRDTIRQQEIKGREDISALVNQTVDKVSDKDERDFISKILGSEVWSRKKKLQEIANEIEERTKITKSEYQQKMDNQVKEKLNKAAQEVIEQIRKYQANSK